MSAMKRNSQLPVTSRRSGAAPSVRMSSTERELLTDIAEFLLLYGITPALLRALMEPAFARSAARGARLKNGRTSYSRIAAKTGLPRSAVKNLLRDWPGLTGARASPLTQIVDGWRSNRKFLDGAGKPRVLAIDDEKRGFIRLARLYVPDIPYRALCAELLEAGHVSIQNDSIRLRSRRRRKNPLPGRFRVSVSSLLTKLSSRAL